jgi:Fe-S-cluster containining protein
MKTIDGKDFECIKCGACCKWEGVVVLTPEDIGRIAKHLSVDKDEFLEEYTKKQGKNIVLKNKPESSSCVFLEDNKCKIWDVKPKQCADFPMKYEKRCPGFHIDDRSASMSDKYERAVKAVSQRLSSSGEFEKGVIENAFKSLHQTIKSASIVSVASENGIDPFLDDSRMKVASLDDLFSFDRLGSTQLIHKSTRDLWAIDSDKDGNVQIKRLFDNTGEPIKG